MRFRAPAQSDLEAVFAVIVARDIVDFGAPDFTLDDLREEWSQSGLDLNADARVVEEADGRIVAYAIVRRGAAIVLVAPDREGDGIGARLLAWVEQRDRERGHTRHRQYVAAGGVSAHRLLRAAGYEVVRSHWRMTVDILAVDPAHQGRGIGRATLRTALAGFAAAGLQGAQLGVSAQNPRALRLYESVGMTQKFRIDTFERLIG
jgi:GNAT superfamily N-acetyltransferase